MADYPGAPSVALSSVNQSQAAAFEVASGQTVKVSALFPASSWGQAVILHNVITGAQILLNPPVYTLGNKPPSTVLVNDPGNHLISAWAWYGGNAQGNPGPNRWIQVPLANQTPPIPTSPAVGAASFLGPLDPAQAPGPAGNVGVSWTNV